MGRAVWVLGMVLSSACTSAELFSSLPPVQAADDVAFFVLVEENPVSGAIERATAHTAQSGPLRVAIGGELEPRLYLLWYEGAPEEHGLELGEIQRVAPNETGAPLPQPLTAWTLELDVDSSPAWDELTNFDPAQLSLRVPTADPCAAFTDVSEPWEIDELPFADLQSVVPFSADRLLLGGYRLGPAAPGRVLGFADFREAYRPLAPPLRGQDIRGLVHMGARVFGVTGEELFELHPATGDLVQTSTIPFGPWQLTVGASGQGIAFEPGSNRARRVELEPLSSTPLALPEAFETILAIDAGLAFGAVGDRVHSFDGTSWRLESTLGGGQITQFFTNGERVGLILDARFILLRSAPGEWTSLPAPAQTLIVLEFGAFMTDDLIVLAGEGGATFGWTGERWCDILTGIQRSARGIALTEDRGVAFVYSFAENDAQRAPIVRIAPRKG